MAPWFHHAMLELRDYANEGGKLIVAGRNVHQAPTGTTTRRATRACRPPARTRGRRTSCSASTTRTTTAATTTCRAPRSCARAARRTTRGRTTSASSGRQGGVGVARHRRTPAPRWRRGRRPVRRHAGDHDRRRAPATTRTRTPTARRCRRPRPRSACATGRAPRRRNEPLRAERVEADYATTPAQNATGGAIISTRDTVTFGFGLEQVDPTHPRRAAQAQPELPGADHGRHHAADDRRLQVAAGRVRGDARPTRSRST